MASSPKRLRLPARGRLLVAADLQGNVRDFLQIIAHFERLGPEGHLLLLGDVLHGPYMSEADWPAGPGMPTPYRDESPAILLKLSLLQEKHPGRVFTLLGNHEHAHIGGPRTSRFAPDETAAMQRRLGPEVSDWLADWLETWPLWATSPAGLLFSHAAPDAVLGGPDQVDALEEIDYERYEAPVPASTSTARSDDAPARLLGNLLWARSLSPERARHVLAAVGCQVAVYGHEVVDGYETIGRQQLILSSSFGLPDEKKRVLVVDLGHRYESVADLRPGTGIVPLY